MLDNFEHVLPAIPLINNLLQSCPRLTVLVTSRVALRLSGESEFPVAPLKLPPTPTKKAQLLSSELEVSREYPAITLFVERAQAVKPSFQLDLGNAGAVIEICRRLDGLPLALELVAAWIKMLPPQSLLTRLIDSQERIRLQMLTIGGADMPERQQTIWASLDWSYNLLSQTEQTLLRRLAIFSGGWELSAAEEICAEERLAQTTVIASLYQLINHSLVVVDESAQDNKGYTEPRFHMLETIRQYGWEKLQAAKELASLQERYLNYYLNLAEEAEKGLLSEEKLWLTRLATEVNNIRAALTWGLESKSVIENRREYSLRIAAALRWFWMRYSLTEGRRWLEQALENLPAQMNIESNMWRAKGLVRVGIIALHQRDYHSALAWCEESEQLYRALNYEPGLAETLRPLSTALSNFGEYDRATVLAQESLELAQKIGDKHLEGSANGQLGRLCYLQEDYIRARFYYEEGVRLWREIGYSGAIATGLLYLSSAIIAQKDYRRARQIFKEMLEIHQDLEDHWAIAALLESGLAKLAQAEGKTEQAVIFLGAASTLRETIDWKLKANHIDSQTRIINTLHKLLGEESFNVLYEQGRQMTPEQVLTIWEQAEVSADK